MLFIAMQPFYPKQNSYGGQRRNCIHLFGNGKFRQNGGGKKPPVKAKSLLQTIRTKNNKRKHHQNKSRHGVDDGPEPAVVIFLFI